MAASTRQGLVRAALATLLCGYVPYAWLVAAAPPWNAYRWSWIRLWPVLPGLLPRRIFFRDAPETAGVAGMAAFTLIVLAVFVAWGRRGTGSLVCGSSLLLALSVLNSWGAYHVCCS